MNDKQMKELMIDYIDGRLTGELKDFVKKHIEKSATNRREFESLKETIDLIGADRSLEPDSDLKLDFLAELEREMEDLEEDMAREDTKVIGFRLSGPWQVAAAITLLAVGVLSGIWLTQQNDNKQDMLVLKKELEITKNIVMEALRDQHSPSQRMLGVNASYNMEKADDELVGILVKTMNEDENVNVRLAAINALAKFADNPKVTKALIASLEKQRDPLVQITLINLMVELKEKGALDKLKQMIEDSTNVESVKDEAHMAVFKLS